MIRTALKGISTRRMRTTLTALAIVLGVAMVSGAYTLSDTMRGAADSLSKSSYEGTAAVVSAKTASITTSPGPEAKRPSFSSNGESSPA
jgi:putative ABC transport system permease protein